jgi:hypothetical protein
MDMGTGKWIWAQNGYGQGKIDMGTGKWHRKMDMVMVMEIYMDMDMDIDVEDMDT